MRVWLTAAMLCSLASTALATTWNVTSDATMLAANAGVQPGDVVQIANGVYTKAPYPARNGTSAARITYIGNLTTPNMVQVPGADFAQQYVTVKGMRFTSSASISKKDEVTVNGILHDWNWQFPLKDSLSTAKIIGSFGMTSARNCMISDVAVGNDTVDAHFNISSEPLGVYGNGGTSYADSVKNTTMLLRDSNASCGLIFKIQGIDYGIYVDSLYFKSVTVNIKSLNGNGSECQPVGIYRMRYALFDTFSLYHDELGSSDTYNHRAWRLRDGCFRNRFLNCLFDLQNTGGGETYFEFTDSGSNEAGVGAGGNNYWYNTWVRSTVNNYPNGYGPIAAQFGFSGDTLSYCTIVASGVPVGEANAGALTVINGFGNFGETVMDHCTVATAGSGGALHIDGTNYGSYGFKATNNIFYAQSTSQDPNNVAVWMRPGANGGRPAMDYNLYTCWAGNGRSVGVANGTAMTYFSPTGFLAGGNSHSIYGSPAWQDSTIGTAFNPDLTVGSAAIGTGFNGSDIGSDRSNVDVTAPSAITLYSTGAGKDFVTLAWQSTGDDATTGKAQYFDLRVSTSTITSGTFSATPDVSGEPYPSTNGTWHFMKVPNLSPSTTYYFAIKAVDDGGNASTMSNVVSKTTLARVNTFTDE